MHFRGHRAHIAERMEGRRARRGYLIKPSGDNLSRSIDVGVEPFDRTSKAPGIIETPEYVK